MMYNICNKWDYSDFYQLQNWNGFSSPVTKKTKTKIICIETGINTKTLHIGCRKASSKGAAGHNKQYCTKNVYLHALP